MPLLEHHRNHSFPPSLRFIHRTSSKYLSPPLPSIDDEPWTHFLSPVIDDDDYDDLSDYLDFNAGIISTSEDSKKKLGKFRPSSAKKWSQQSVHYHHGSFHRPEEHHGFVENRHDPWSHIVELDINKSTETKPLDIPLRPRGRSKTRTLSGHRHSWREPSVDLFTVEEEAEYAKANKEEVVFKKDPVSRNHESTSTDDQCYKLNVLLRGMNDRARL